MQMCQDRLKYHQGNAHTLWNENKMRMAWKKSEYDSASPGPGSYIQHPNKFYNSFTGEGAQSSFGRTPRLPIHANANERKTAWDKLQQRRASQKIGNQVTINPVMQKEGRIETMAKPGYSFKGESRSKDPQSWHYHEVKQWPKCSFTQLNQRI